MKTDFKTVQVAIEDGVAVFTMNNPPVNQLSDYFIKDLVAAFEEAWKDDQVYAIVLTGEGKNFVAGADITQLQKMKNRDEAFGLVMEGHKFYNAIELSPKPVIAAINGNCLGGGLELAMCCHYRVAVKGVSLGLPEVSLGLLPGGGGTQRLPRIIGLPNAAQMMTTGKPIKAEVAFVRGLVDEVCAPDKLLKKALGAAKMFKARMFNQKSRTARMTFYRLPSFNEKLHFMNYIRAMVGAQSKGYIAPGKILDCLDKGLSTDFEADLKVEANGFADLVTSAVAKNLIGMFLNTRSAGRLPRIKDVKPAKPMKVAQLGGGVMGCGIVHLLLANGFECVLWDINDAALAKGVESVKKTFAFMIKKKKMKPADLDKLLAEKLTTTTKLEDLGDVDLVIEAVLENMKVKQDIWLTLEKTCRPDVIFGTNTSALPITEMASVLKDPGRMIGLHFFNPAERMQLLEIICAQQTSDQTLATSVDFGRRIKKVPIVVNDGPGFYVSRQLGGLMGGSVFLVADGVSGEAIEKAMVNFGMPMGPATLADLTGIDINYHVNQTFARELGDRYTVHPLTEAIYNLGDYGRKTGRGYMDYTSGKPAPNPRLQQVVADYLKANNVAPKDMPEQEIIDAMLGLAINEAALMIEQGICDRPADMDLAMIYGTGFPPYRGGILRYADTWGLKNVYETLVKLEGRYGKRFAPAKLIKDMAEKGETFYKE